MRHGGFREMTFDKLLGLLEENELHELIDFMQSMIRLDEYMETPYLINQTLKLLSDDSPLYNLVTDGNKKALCIMLQKYYENCFDYSLGDNEIEDKLKYGKIMVYKIYAANGLRYATEKEVELGVKGLQEEPIYPATQETYEMLCLLQWTLTGSAYYFRQAGYRLEYGDNREVKNTFYEMIQMCAEKLNNLFEWIKDSDRVEKALRIMAKMKKNKGYKYASYEKDEVTEDIPLKQIVYNICKTFPRGSENPEYRRALAIALNNYNNKKRMTVMEVSFLRTVYEKFAVDRTAHKEMAEKEAQAQVDVQLKEECQALLDARNTRDIDSQHFCYKIIDTLKRNGYTRCSAKQRKIIESALQDIGYYKNKEKNKIAEPKVEILSDDMIDASLDTLANAVNMGLFDDLDE